MRAASVLHARDCSLLFLFGLVLQGVKCEVLQQQEQGRGCFCVFCCLSCFWVFSCWYNRLRHERACPQLQVERHVARTPSCCCWLLAVLVAWSCRVDKIANWPNGLPYSSRTYGCFTPTAVLYSALWTWARLVCSGVSSTKKLPPASAFLSDTGVLSDLPCCLKATGSLCLVCLCFASRGQGTYGPKFSIREEFVHPVTTAVFIKGCMHLSRPFFNVRGRAIPRIFLHCS